METKRKKRNRLFVDQLDTVGLVDKGDDPMARIVFTKARERLELDTLVQELQEKVSAWMFARQGRPGPVSRDVGTVRILASNPELFKEIERLASTDALHKAAEVRPGVERRAGVDSVVATLSQGLAPGDGRLGMMLCERHFPALMKRWRGVES